MKGSGEEIMYITPRRSSTHFHYIIFLVFSLDLSLCCLGGVK
jgi:hypothetical protein